METPNDEMRPVWLNHDKRRVLRFSAEFLRAKGFDHDAADLDRIVNAWDAAPADSAEAVRNAIAGGLIQQKSSSHIAPAVLAALGLSTGE